MRLSFTVALELLSIFQSLFFSVYLLVRRRPPRPANVVLAVLLGTLAAQIGANVLVDQGVEVGAPAFDGAGWILKLALLLDGTCGLLYGPLLLGFVLALTFGRRLRRADAAHLLPFVLAVPTFAWRLLSPDALTGAVFICLAVYLGASFRALRNYRRAIHATRSDLQPVRLAWLSIAVAGLAVVLGLNILSYLAGRTGHGTSPALSLGLFAVVLVWVSSFVVAALWEPQLFAQIGEREQSAVAAATQELTPRDHLELRRLESLLLERRLYLDSQLTLTGLAVIAGISIRRVSKLVNRGRAQTFSDWVNHFRVEEAKRLLDSSGDAKTILTIMEECGFNSKSTFNAVFKQKTGFSPSEWRQRQGASVQRGSSDRAGARLP